MKDPAQIAEAVENLVWMHWDFIGTARLDRRLDVEVEYVTDSGEVTSCSGVYEYEKIPEIVEEFLRK